MLFLIIIILEYISKSDQIAPEFVNFLTIRRSKAEYLYVFVLFLPAFYKKEEFICNTANTQAWILNAR